MCPAGVLPRRCVATARCCHGAALPVCPSVSGVVCSCLTQFGAPLGPVSPAPKELADFCARRSVFRKRATSCIRTSHASVKLGMGLSWALFRILFSLCRAVWFFSADNNRLLYSEVQQIISEMRGVCGCLQTESRGCFTNDRDPALTDEYTQAHVVP